MAVFTCKMCGATLNIEEGKSVATCNYCGTAQTLPSQKNEKIAAIFNRANHFRLHADFDKAQALYEKIIEEGEKDCEAHWGVVLCKYGIEYVDDAKTKTRIPTCHRTQMDSILSDVDYQEAISLCDNEQKAIYQKEAKAIDKIQKGILSIVQAEEPYDVFICYKETDEKGKRTRDSVIANDIYHELTEIGYKVFYAAITLEDKLGREYEPYIFAALNSAKVMLVVGTKAEYFNAPWVKNEWSRYLKIMQTDKKRLLIPCYRDMDAYDMPEEFAYLQAQDMGKIGFIEDVIRGIKKVLKKDEPKVVVQEKVVVKETVAVPTPMPTQDGVAAPNIAALLMRAQMFLEDGDFSSAKEYAEKVLDSNPTCADAYMVELCCACKVKKETQLVDCKEAFWEKTHYAKAKRFADGERLAQIEGYYTTVMERLYTTLKKKMTEGKTAAEYTALANEWKALKGYKDGKQQGQICAEWAYEAEKAEKERAENAKKEENYRKAMDIARKDTVEGYEQAISLLQKYPDWKISAQLIENYKRKIIELKAYWAEVAERVKKEEKKKRITKTVAIIGSIVVGIGAIIGVIKIPAYDNVKENGIRYEKIEDGYKVTSVFYSYTEDYENVVIPDKIRGLPVTEIADEVFLKNSYLKAIQLPNHLKRIGKSTFYECTNLTSIDIPDSVKYVGEWAFGRCFGLTEIDIPDSLKVIEKQAFSVCSNVTSITLPDGLEQIEYGGLCYNSKLENIAIPDGVKVIGEYAFKECASLQEVVIPDSVEVIAVGAFEACNALESVYYGGTTSDWTSIQVESSNAFLTTYMYYYSESAPTTSGKYWHYVDGVPTVWGVSE